MFNELNKTPESYTDFFKEELKKELDRTNMVNLEVLAGIVARCNTLEKHVTSYPYAFPGQFLYREWITANQLLFEHGYDQWGDHTQARAIDGNWELYFNGDIQRCQKCHTFAFRNDINYPKNENPSIWTCVECKTDFVWPTKKDETNDQD
ncbi:MAG: hypothetical protein ACW96M_05380 [Candidatus Thorarchaeota archaeon]|jgi:hypothetical protein